MSEHESGEATGPHDEAALQLQELRRAAGDPSLAEIARLVGHLRQARGVASAAALPPRTTVYDAFRLGRRRLDRDLVADLTLALSQEAERMTSTAAPLGPEIPELPASPDLPASPELVAPEEVAGVTVQLRLVILALCVGMNLIGLSFIDGLSIPIWLDMIGTAIAAVALGPWWGVGVALSSTVLDGMLTDDYGYWFAPVTVAGALVWGYGVRRFGMARTPGRFFLLTVLVAVVSTALAVPITVLAFGGYTPHDSSRVAEVLAEQLPWLVLAVFFSNLIFSMLDKLVSGFVALAAMDVMARRWPWLEKVLRG